VSASGGQKPQFLANFDFLGAPVPTPFYRSGPNLMCYSIRLRAKFGLDRFILSPFGGENPNFCGFLDFGI